MSNTSHIVYTIISRRKQFVFSTGKTAGNRLQVEYSTIQVDAERFDTAKEAKDFIKNLHNPFEREFKTEVVEDIANEVIYHPDIDFKNIDKQAIIKKIKP